jgi:hypothetical protein
LKSLRKSIRKHALYDEKADPHIHLPSGARDRIKRFLYDNLEKT